MKLFQKYAAEFLGTFILVGVGTGTVISVGVTQGDVVLPVALGFGLALMVALYMLGGKSGGHFNPAVSLAAFLDKRIGLTDMAGYWVMQVAGAVSASALLAWIYNREFVAYTYTTLNRQAGVNEMAGFFAEAVLTLVFVFAILVLARSEAHTRYIGMGIALAVVHLVGLVMTGSGVNPARSFAPALVGGTWDGFWVFVAGPALGAIVAWALYKIIIEGDLKLGDDLAEVREAVVEEAEEVFSARRSVVGGGPPGPPPSHGSGRGRGRASAEYGSGRGQGEGFRWVRQWGGPGAGFRCDGGGRGPGEGGCRRHFPSARRPRGPGV
ncbi:MAG: aquaporin [Actinomycetota bacterium]